MNSILIISIIVALIVFVVVIALILIYLRNKMRKQSERRDMKAVNKSRKDIENQKLSQSKDKKFVPETITSNRTVRTNETNPPDISRSHGKKMIRKEKSVDSKDSFLSIPVTQWDATKETESSASCFGSADNRSHLKPLSLKESFPDFSPNSFRSNEEFNQTSNEYKTKSSDSNKSIDLQVVKEIINSEEVLQMSETTNSDNISIDSSSVPTQESTNSDIISINSSSVPTQETDPQKSDDRLNIHNIETTVADIEDPEFTLSTI